jgi:Domain of unknown function (DUF1707)
VIAGEAPVTPGPEDQKASAAGRHGRFRASHADREHAIETLKTAFVEGRLTKDELDLRVGRTLASRTYADLAALTADIPAGLAPAQPPRKPARAGARPPMNIAAKSGIWVSTTAVMLVAASFIGGESVILVAVTMLMALLAAGAQSLYARHERRSGGQLPPRPAQRRRALEGEQDGWTGDDLILCEARKDVRAHSAHRGPVRAVIQRTWRSLPVRRAQHQPANLQATA